MKFQTTKPLYQDGTTSSTKVVSIIVTFCEPRISLSSQSSDQYVRPAPSQTEGAASKPETRPCFTLSKAKHTDAPALTAGEKHILRDVTKNGGSTLSQKKPLNKPSTVHVTWLPLQTKYQKNLSPKHKTLRLQLFQRQLDDSDENRTLAETVKQLYPLPSYTRFPLKLIVPQKIYERSSMKTFYGGKNKATTR